MRRLIGTWLLVPQHPSPTKARGQLAGGGMCFPLFHYVKDQFDTTGDPEFVIDVEQIVAHRVLSDGKLQGNFLVRQA